jgi:hypothetical protein
MGYKEEIFSRLEREGFESIDEISEWLAGPKKDPASYRNFAAQLQEPFAIRDAVRTEDDIFELEDLEEEARTLEIDDGGETLRQVRTRLNRVREIERERIEAEIEQVKEEEEEQEEQSMQVGERYILADQWRAATSKAERQAIEEQIRELPYGGQVIGGLRRTKR